MMIGNEAAIGRSLSSECIMVVPPQLDVDVDVGTFPSRGHLDVSLSRPYQRHSDTGYRQATNQAGQARPDLSAGLSSGSRSVGRSQFPRQLI